MPNSTFAVGQEVVVLKSRHTQAGSRGIVVAVDNSKRRDTVGVMLVSGSDRGHDLEGNCPDGFGRWFSPEQLIALVD